jgi:hypothetical protein
MKADLDYVRAALELQGYDLDEPRLVEVARQFARIDAIAQAMLDVELPLDAEPAPLFRP